MDKLPFKAEYAKSGRAACKGCFQKIAKGVLRLAVMVQSEYYDGKQANWHHEECLFRRHRPKTIADIGRLNTLKHDDQKRIAQAIENCSGKGKKGKGKATASKRLAAVGDEYSKPIKTEVPVKKLKAEPKTDEDIKEEQELENELPEIHLSSSLENFRQDVRTLNKETKIEEQNNLFSKFREALEGVKRKDLRELLLANEQREPRGRNECIIRIADMMAFGAPQPCDVCRHGQLVLNTYGYNCTGHFSEWSRCTNIVQEPKRKKMEVPPRVGKLPAFKDYIPRVGVRIFEAAPPPAVVKKSQPDSIGSSQSDLWLCELRRPRDMAAVDPDSGLQYKAHVYRDPEGTVWTCVLGRTDVGADKNSCYKMQVLEAHNKKKYWMFRSWGRIGTTLNNKLDECGASLSHAQTLFEEKYEERTRNLWECRKEFQKFPGYYYPLDVQCEEDEDAARALHVARALHAEEESKMPVPVQNLVRQIFDIDFMKQTLREFALDTDKMPLGKLSKKQIKAGYEVLSDLLEKIENGQANQHIVIDSTNRFYTLVPHNFGTRNPPLLDNVELIEQKAEMLNNLMEIEIAYSFFKTEPDSGVGLVESHYLKLKAEIVPLDASSPELELLQRYVRNTHGDTHSQYTLDIEQVFKVYRQGEDERFKPFKSMCNRRLLWHGSRTTNFAGILSQGLRIAPPEAPTTGYMFGKGIYFADMVSKSANYCGTSQQRPVGVLLLCEVALGHMKVCTRAEYVRKLPRGKSSVWGVGRTQPDPADDVTLPDGTVVPCGKPQHRDIHTELLYNEFIVYNVAQVNVKYLFQLKFNFK